MRALIRALLTLPLVLGVAALPSGASADHAGPEPGPIHAGNTYGWWKAQGGIVWREEFETASYPEYWKVSHGRLVRNQHGMLTLNTRRSGSVTATLDFPGAETGRWETRLRSRKYGRGGKNFKVVTELVPAGDAAERCGAQNIALESYKIGKSKAKLYANALPDLAFRGEQAGMDLGRDRWHTYAVEVTHDRISWFVDAHVVHTETRPEALSGVPLTVRFTMQARPGKQMNVSRMQMDWLRHWSLKAPNTLPVDAPPMREAHYGRAC